MKNWLFDQFGAFSFYDLPSVLLSLFAAGALTALAAWLIAPGSKELRSGVALAALAALAVLMVRGSAPLAIALVGVVLLLNGGEGSVKRTPVHLVAVVVGLGCGAGATAIVAMLLVPVALLWRWVLAVRG